MKRKGVGVVYVDVDRFHQINTRWGHTAGDRVLDLLGPRLASRLPDGAALAATEGGAYLAVLPGADPTETRVVAEGLLAAVRESIALADITLSVGATAGFSCQGLDDQRVDLIEQAFLACRRAKATARGTAVGYEVALGADAQRHQRTEDGLRRAIAEGQLRLHIQPTVDLRDGQVTGVEALVRWQHPTDGLLMPVDFLAVAEAAGLIGEIGDWMVDEALALAARWRATRPDAAVRVWVNLATQQLADGDRLCARVRSALEQLSISPADIGFEVTESSLLEDLPSAVGVLTSLRELGVEIALDDFGTGYSSLSYLRRLPVTAVKIDRVFVAGIGGSLADEAIVEAVIDLAHALGLRVIAEGIEDEVQVATLIRMGADEAQGFLFSEPKPVHELEPLPGTRWCSAAVPSLGETHVVDRRADQLPGFGSPRARLLLAALDTAHDSILVTAAADFGRAGPPIVYVNAGFEAETGYRSRDVVGHTLEMLLADPSPELLGWYSQVHAEGPATTELASRRADGSTYVCEVTLSPISDERGVHTHWLHVRRDLTKRRAVEGDRARFQGLIEQSSSLVTLTESSGKWLYVNAAQRRALGMGLDDSLDGVSTTSMYTPEQLRQIADEVLPTIEREGRWCGPVTYVNRLTGAVTEVESDVQAVLDPLRPGVQLFAWVSRDVTEANALAAADRRRRELGALADRLAQHALDLGGALFADPFTVLAAFGELLNADLAYLDTIDLEAGILRPLGDWTSPRYRLPVVPPKEVDLGRLPNWIARLQGSRMMLGSTTDEHTTPWAAELNSVFGIHPSGANLYAPLRVAGVLIGVLGLSNFDESHAWSADEIATVQQVADTLASLLGRQRSDNALRASEAHLAAMLAKVDEMLVVIDREGRMRYANALLERTVGYRVAEIVGSHFIEFVHPDDHAQVTANFARTVSGDDERSLSELRILRPDGSATWCEVDTSGVFDDVLGGFVLSLRDISVQRAVIEAAARRHGFERVVLEIARWALANESEEPLAGLDVHLQLLAEVLGCDEASASLLDGDQIHTIAHWSAEGAPTARLRQRDDSGDADAAPITADQPALAARYRTLEPLVVTDIFEVDEPWAAESRSRPSTYRSTLHAPLISGDRCLGDIGVAMAAAPREWTTEEISLVQRVSETLASLLARQRVEASLRKSEARLGALLDGSHNLVAVIASDGTLLFANDAFQRRLGHRPEDLVGRNISAVVHPDDLATAMRQLETLFAAEPTRTTTLRLIEANGSVGWWEITSSGNRDPIAGGLFLVGRDVTARLRAEDESATRVEHLRYAFGVAQSALDLDTHEFLERLDQLCATIAAMLGVDTVYVDQFDERRGWLINQACWSGDGAAQLPQAGHEIPLSLIPAWVEKLREPHPVVLCDARDRDEPWLTEKRRAQRKEVALIAVGMSAAGELVGVLGVSMRDSARDWSTDEVTFLRLIADTIAHVFERSRVDEALRTSEARFRLLSETAADVVILLDAAGTVRYASPSSKGLLGFTPDELLGRTARSLIHRDHAHLLAAAIPTLLSGLPFTSEVQIVRADGSAVWVANSTSAVIEQVTGQPIEYRISVRDITERKRLETELERQALHDPLTGLANRILLHNRLAEAAAPKSPTGHVAVLLLDLDGFKDVNDTFGHAVGDHVLRIVASRLAGLTRPTDTLARTGGDEFVVLCPDTELADAVSIGERMVGALNQSIVTDEITVSLGASVGVAHHLGEGADPDSLLLRADSAMYRAKQAGRGQVAFADNRTFGRSPPESAGSPPAGTESN